MCLAIQYRRKHVHMRVNTQFTIAQCHTAISLWSYGLRVMSSSWISGSLQDRSRQPLSFPLSEGRTARTTNSSSDLWSLSPPPHRPHDWSHSDKAHYGPLFMSRKTVTQRIVDTCSSCWYGRSHATASKYLTLSSCDKVYLCSLFTPLMISFRVQKNIAETKQPINLEGKGVDHCPLVPIILPFSPHWSQSLFPWIELSL